jgi:hypothetical protein
MTGHPGRSSPPREHLYSSRAQIRGACRTSLPVILDLMDGTSLASLESAMSEIASTYNERTVMFRMRHADGRWAQAVIDPMKSGARAVWFVNGRPLDVRDFADWTRAIEWTERLRAQQWNVGWRVSDDITEGPPARSGS